MNVQAGDPGNSLRKICFQLSHITRFCQCGDLIQMMPHVVPCLPGLLHGGLKVFVALLLQGQQLIFLLQSGVPVQTGRHHQEDRVEPEKKDQQGNAEDDVALQDPAGVERCLIARDHKEIERDEHKGQDPEHIPCLGEIVILDHCSY